MNDLLSNELKITIVKKLKLAKYFSSIHDCTTDASCKEQMSLILRGVDVSLAQI